MSHGRRSLPDSCFRACERDRSLLSSPGTDPPGVTLRACWCRFLDTSWIRRQRRLLSLTHTRPIPVTVVQTLKLQNKRKEKVQRGLKKCRYLKLDGLQHPSSLDEGRDDEVCVDEPNQTSAGRAERAREV